MSDSKTTGQFQVAIFLNFQLSSKIIVVVINVIIVNNANEICLIDVKKSYRIKNTFVKELSGMREIVQIEKSKWTWEGHIARQEEGTTEWVGAL